MSTPPVAAALALRDCVIVGGGPGGVVLALLFARKGVQVTLLEAHPDFDRDFRGDTVHPSTLEMLEGIGLADKVLSIEHVKMSRMRLVTREGSFVVADFAQSGLRFPYIAVLPQDELLELLVAEAKRYPSFEVRMGCRAAGLIEEDGVVGGVRFEGGEIRASLTVGADGRGSRIARLAGFEPRMTSPPMDVLWLRLPRRQGEPAREMTGFRAGEGHVIVIFARRREWQLGYIITKGSLREVREEGLDRLRRNIASLVPELADRVDTLKEWSDVHFLSVESSRLDRWWKPGLLLIGDAAHVMSPVGGVGINYAIQDAVAAGNLLTRPLLDRTLGPEHLQAVQRRRELPTRLIQGVQSILQKQLLSPALAARAFTIPWPIRALIKLPFFRSVMPRVIGMGFRPESVRD